MKLEHFQYLLEINRLHSISAAARVLHIGQTRLSTIVKVVEGELGFPIFQRTPKGISLTPAGERFMTLAWEINVKYEMLMSLKNQAAGDAPVITVLLPPSVALRMALPVTRRFYSFDLQGSLSFEEHPSHIIKELIEKNAANIGIGYLNTEELSQWEANQTSSPLQVEPLREARTCVIVSKEHPLADREWVELRDICMERLASPRGPNDALILRDAQAMSGQVTGFTSVDIMCQAISEQGMVGLVSDFLEAEDAAIDTSHFSFIPLRHTERENLLHICLFTHKGRNLRQQERILALCIREYFGELQKSGELGSQQAQGGVQP